MFGGRGKLRSKNSGYLSSFERGCARIYSSDGTCVEISGVPDKRSERELGFLYLVTFGTVVGPPEIPKIEGTPIAKKYSARRLDGLSSQEPEGPSLPSPAEALLSAYNSLYSEKGWDSSWIGEFRKRKEFLELEKFLYSHF